MKPLTPLIICLVLSLSLVGQVMALQNALPLDSMNKVLQMKIESEVTYSQSDELYFRQNQQYPMPVKQDEIQNNQPESFSVPDCLCHLFTRVI